MVPQRAWDIHVENNAGEGCRLERPRISSQAAQKRNAIQLLSHACRIVRDQCLNEKKRTLDDQLDERAPEYPLGKV